MSSRRARSRLATAAVLFAALGDSTRLAIVQRLADGGPVSISVLAERFAMSRQGLTKHLGVLAAAGLVEGTREGREHMFTLNPDQLAAARGHLDLLSRRWDDALARLAAHVERAQVDGRRRATRGSALE